MGNYFPTFIFLFQVTILPYFGTLFVLYYTYQTEAEPDKIAKIMKYFRAQLKFDYGNFTLITSASTKEDAIVKICKSENCTACAIISITEMSDAPLKSIHL